jgi:hypothetical protein
MPKYTNGLAKLQSDDIIPPPPPYSPMFAYLPLEDQLFLYL